MLNPDSPEGKLRAMGVSPALSAAYDVLDAAGLANHDRLMLCYHAEKGGKDPESVARMLVEKCRLFAKVSAEQTRTEPVTARCQQFPPAALPGRPAFIVGGSGETEAS